MLWYHISNLLKFITSLESYKCIQLHFNYDKIPFQRNFLNKNENVEKIFDIFIILVFES